MTELHRMLSDYEGDLLRPGDPAYDGARAVWNAVHDRKPALVARCTSARDVSAVLRYAAATGLRVTVRGGGHNVAGTAVVDDTVMIDLSALRAVAVDPLGRIARAQGGCLLRDLDAATLAHGLACPAGVVSHTGLGGLALGGGYGWLHRTWGLTCDHLVAAEAVLADGTIVRVDDEHHVDLLWGLRGGGGNFAVVTEFTLRLRPVGPVYLHTGVVALADAPAALNTYRDAAESSSREVHGVAAFTRGGPQDWVPPTLRGQPVLATTVAWFGEPVDGPEHTAPFFAGAAGTSAHTLGFGELQALGDHSEPHGHRYYTKSCYLSRIADGPEPALVACAAEMPSPLSAIDFEFLGGAITDIADEETAFPRRDAPYICTVSAHWTDRRDDSVNVDWSRQGVERLAPWSHGGAYVNYLQDEHPGKAAEVYGTGRYSRLVALKQRYDPKDVLVGNRSITRIPERTP